MPGLSYGQYVGLICTSISTSILSIIGSSLICASVLYRGRSDLMTNTLNQLLLGLSVSDILFTLFGPLLGPFLRPADIDAYNVFGNKASCTASAFLNVAFQTSGCFYNFFMSLHFWRKVRSSQKHIRQSGGTDRRFLIVAHSSTWTFSILLGVLGLVLNGYDFHPFLSICYTYGSGMIVGRIRIALVGLLTAACICFTISIVKTVRRSLRKSARYMKKAMSQITDSTDFGLPTNKMKEWARSLSSFKRNNTSPGAYTNHELPLSDPNTDQYPEPSGRSKEDEPSLPTNDYDGSNPKSTPEGSNRRRSSLLGRKGSRMSRSDNERNQNAEVSVQALWYMAAYLNSFLIPAIAVIVLNATDANESAGQSGYYFLVWCIAFFTPFQGALNFLVFLRPRYMGWKSHLEREIVDVSSSSTDKDSSSMFLILQKALLEDVPKPRKLRRQSMGVSSGTGSGRHARVSFARNTSSEAAKERETLSGQTSFKSAVSQPIVYPSSAMESLSSSVSPEDSNNNDEQLRYANNSDIVDHSEEASRAQNLEEADESMNTETETETNGL